MRYFTSLFLLLTTSLTNINAQNNPIALIPEPVQIKVNKGVFLPDAQTTIIVSTRDSSLNSIAKKFAASVSPALGYTFNLGHDKPAGKYIQLRLDTKAADIKSGEGYTLSVTENSIQLTALKPAGIFYGLQTLRQLFPAAIESKTKQTESSLSVPCVDIVDYPRFHWRGLLLDVSRHFFSKQFVKQYIDEMVRYKFNVLHLHLTDDQGWRIEIKAFPKLTETGAWRVPRTGRWWTYDQPQPEEKPTYGGYYTQEDIKELVRYAAERYVTILPEIDVPGHSLAAIASYPYLSATGYIYPVNPGSKFYNIQDNTLNPADERVYDFLDKLFTEVAALFPGEYIHIGGDECTKEFWAKSYVVQQFMKKNNIASEHEMQSYFIKRLEKILKSKGKKLIGWDEILEGGLAPEATVMSWRGMDGGIAAAKQGHKVVMTPADHVYLDLYQGDPAIEPDTYSMLRLKSTYQWKPVPDSIDASLILGGQGNLWTESVPTERHAEYMTWPRGIALSEVFWSPANKQNWSNFQNKLEPQFDRLQAAEINFSRAAFDVLATAKYNDKKQLTVELSTDIDGLNIYYTIDNTNPDRFSNEYKGVAVIIPEGIWQLRAIAYRNDKPVGNMLILSREELDKRTKD